MGSIITETTLENKNVQLLLGSEEKFDLVIVEQFFSEALMGFAAHFQCPLVLFSSIGTSEWNNHLMGNPNIASISPVSWTSFSRHMSFYQRSINLMATIYDYLYRNYVAYPLQENYLKKYFPHYIDFNKLIYNSSLMLLNSHVTTSENSPLVHGMIEIGGFHIKQNLLDTELQEYLNNAEEGVILFCLGSNLKSSDLPDETINSLFDTFSKLNKKILWKFETDLPNKPKNVRISKWLNQSDVLAHPNIQLFITHGGLLSVTEAIFYGVPMIGIPIFGDQKMNLARASRQGIVQVIPFQELTEERLLSAITEVLNDPS